MSLVFFICLFSIQNFCYVLRPLPAHSISCYSQLSFSMPDPRVFLCRPSISSETFLCYPFHHIVANFVFNCSRLVVQQLLYVFHYSQLICQKNSLRALLHQSFVVIYIYLCLYLQCDHVQYSFPYFFIHLFTCPNLLR